MLKKICFVLSIMVGMLPAACVSAAQPVQPAVAPTGTVGALPNGASIKAGLVADTAGVNDQAFNQYTCPLTCSEVYCSANSLKRRTMPPKSSCPPVQQIKPA